MSPIPISSMEDKEEKYDYPLYKFSTRIILIYPLISILTAIIGSLSATFLLHYDRSTRTHCQNWQFFPSISATIGVDFPEKFIWRAGVALYVAPRYMFNDFNNYLLRRIICKKRNPDFFSGRFNFLNNFCFILITLENLSLVTLTYVSSTEIFWIHSNSFIFFLIFSFAHYLVDMYICRKVFSPASEGEKKSFEMEKIHRDYSILSHPRCCLLVLET